MKFNFATQLEKQRLLVANGSRCKIIHFYRKMLHRKPFIVCFGNTNSLPLSKDYLCEKCSEVVLKRKKETEIVLKFFCAKTNPFTLILFQICSAHWSRSFDKVYVTDKCHVQQLRRRKEKKRSRQNKARLSMQRDRMYDWY